MLESLETPERPGPPESLEGPFFAGRASQAVFGLLAAVLLLGCQGDRTPDLLAVHRLDPARGALSDRITITGEGFPEGRDATVTFRGDLFRPGAPSQRDVRIAAHAVPSGRNALTLTLDAPIERRFVGAGESAVHTTFHGDVRVSYQAKAGAATAVSGTAHDVVFDVLPADRVDADAANKDAAAVLAALGMSVMVEPSGVGLRVASVVPDGRAAASAVRAGDVLLELDSVTIVSASDLAPRPGAQTENLTVLRDGRVLPALALDVEGIAPLGASDLAWPACALLVAALSIMLAGSRIGRALSFAEVTRARSTLGSAAQAPTELGAAASALVRPLTTGRELSTAAALVFGAVLFALVRIATGRALISPDLDLGSLVLSSSGALCLARFADGGTRAGASWSFLVALRALGHTLVQTSVLLIAMAGVVLANGRFVISEMVAEQGGAPLRWAAVQNPGLAVLVVLLLGSAIPTADEAPSTTGEPAVAAPPERSVLQVLVRLAEWSYLWVSCALAVLMFFGGYRLPGVASLAQESSRNLSLAGAALLVAKVTAVALGVGAARTALGRPTVSVVLEIALRRVLPIALGAAFVAGGFASFLESAPSATLSDLSARTILALVVLASGHFVVQVVRERRRPAVTTLNPWL